MNKSNKFVAGALLLFPVAASAADYPWLTFAMDDGSAISLASDALDIDYADGNLLISSPTVEEVIPVAQVSSMHFSSTLSGISGVNGEINDIWDYYDLNGTCVGNFSDADAARSSLPSGIYVMKNGTSTSKVIF